MKKLCLLLLFFTFGKILSMQRDYSDVGIDLSGNGVVIFEDLGTGFIYSNVYSGGSPSATTTQISTNGLSSSIPKLAFDTTTGYAVAVWITQDPVNGANLLYGSVYFPPTAATPGWTTPTAITTNIVNVSPEHIRVFINQQGSSLTALATWSENNSITGNQEIAVATATTSGWGTFTILP